MLRRVVLYWAPSILSDTRQFWIMNNADQKPLIDNSRLETRDRVTDVKRFPMKPFKFATLFKGNVASSNWEERVGITRGFNGQG